MKIDVLQLNAWYEANPENVAKLIGETGADIVCLQELTQGYHEQQDDDTIKIIQRKLGFDAVYQSIPINDPESGHWHQANAIFSRFPISRSRRRWLYVATSETDQNRGYIEADILFAGRRLTAATSHMSFKDLEDQHDEFRQDAADHELESLLAVTSARQRDYILGLDANEEPDSRRVKALLERFSHAGPDLSVKTWPTIPQEFPGFESGEPKRRLDYILTTSDIKTLRAEAVETEKISDHLGLLATLELDAA